MAKSTDLSVIMRKVPFNAYTILRREGINSLEELCKCTRQTVANFDDMTDRDLTPIENALKKRGMQLSE